MRPTVLDFRSPKERTPDAYYPSQTFTGKSLFNRASPRKTSLPLSKRFPQYDIESKKTGYRVGPGAYTCPALSNGIPRIKGTHVYKTYSGDKQTGDNTFYYIGNHLVRDTRFPSTSPDWNKRMKRRTLSGDTSPTLDSENDKSPWFIRKKNSARETEAARSRSCKKNGKSPYMSSPFKKDSPQKPNNRVKIN